MKSFYNEIEKNILEHRKNQINQRKKSRSNSKEKHKHKRSDKEHSKQN